LTAGRIVFELFTHLNPKTCENFRCLCTGEKGEGKTTFKPLHYKGTPFHRVVKGFIIQGGDFFKGDGSGGESIYGGLFKDENLKVKHDKPFLLSMANKGPDTNGSQFFITTRPAPHLDGIHVVFGRVVSGHQFVSDIENQKVDTKSRPYADIRIANCGELVLMRRGKAVTSEVVESVSSSSSESSSEGSEEDDDDSSSDEDEKAKKKKRSKKNRDKVTCLYFLLERK
jgi:peptidyl-prolyl isomerase G (cyclophilin G)